MAASSLRQLAQLRATRDSLTDQHLTLLGIANPAPLVAAPAPQPSPAASAPAPAPAPQQPAPVVAPPAPSGSAQQIAMGMLASYGWSSSQFSCLDPLWQRESGWNVYAANPDGAYGIPQAMPGSKMASAGPDWQTDAATQIRWGLNYIQAIYGSPCAAWSHEEATGWY
jgi:resuscitation-promoting factor RpfB